MENTIILLLTLSFTLGHGSRNSEFCRRHTPKVLTHQIVEAHNLQIDYRGCRILELNFEPFQHHPKAFVIDLGENFIRRLRRDLFAKVPELEYVNVDQNLLTIIDDGTFAGLDLTNIDIQRNYLDLSEMTDLLKDKSMKKVYVSYNNKILYPIEGAPAKEYKLEHVFGLRDAEILHLFGNSYVEVKKGVFDGLPSLFNLGLADNKLVALHEGLLDNNTLLEYVNFSKNKLKSVHRKLFAKNPLLVEVDLSANQLEKLPFDIFIRNTKLKSLILSHNQFSSVNEANFYFTPGLTHLSLGHNRLSTLPEETFANNLQLKSLDLSGNGIEDLHPDLFAQNAKLTCVDLSKNRISSVPRSLFATNRFLTTLEMSGNLLQSLSDGSLPPRLQNLVLDGNRFEEMPLSALAERRSLLVLSMDGNGLTRVPEDVFSALPKLHQLQIARNRLRRLPDGLLLAGPPSASSRTVYLALNPLDCACLAGRLPTAGGSASGTKVDGELFSDGSTAPCCMYYNHHRTCDDGSAPNEDIMGDWEEAVFGHRRKSLKSFQEIYTLVRNSCKYF